MNSKKRNAVAGKVTKKIKVGSRGHWRAGVSAGLAGDIRRREEIFGIGLAAIDAVIPQDRRGAAEYMISRRNSSAAARRTKSARLEWTGDGRSRRGRVKNNRRFARLSTWAAIDGLLHITT